MKGSNQADLVRDEIVGFIKKSEDAMSEAGHRWSDMLHDFVPGDGESVRQAVGEVFDYMDRILKAQREFANSVLDPVLKAGAPPARTSKKAPAAAKRTAKRPATTSPRSRARAG